MKRNDPIEELLQKHKAPAPDPALKDAILSRVAAEAPVPKKQASPRAVAWRKPLLAAALIALLVCTCSLGAAGLYFEEYESVYVDTNPSVELVLNRFERIHKVIYHNEDAQSTFRDVDLRGMRAEDGMGVIIDVLVEQGYAGENAEICISTSSKKGADTQKLLEKMTKKAQQQAQDKGAGASFSGEKLSKQEIEQAKEQGISPAKLKRIEAILALDPSQSRDQLEQMTIKELSELHKQLTKESKK